MKKYFVPYDIALALKEIGFDEPCFTYWVHDGQQITFATDHNRSGWSMIGFTNSQMVKKAGLCTAPIYDQVIDWFIENHNLFIIPDICGSMGDIRWTVGAFGDMKQYAIYMIEKGKENDIEILANSYKNRYKALNAGILKAVELVKQKV